MATFFRQSSSELREKEWRDVSEGVDMMALGKHCEVEHCRQLDLLPFTCRACHMVTCSEHFRDHACSGSPPKATTTASTTDRQSSSLSSPVHGAVVVCATCKHRVRADGMTASEALASHLASGCTQHKLKKTKALKRKCCVSGCRRKEITNMTCSACSQTFCLGHRLPLDHDCAKRQAKQQQRKSVVVDAASLQAQSCRHHNAKAQQTTASRQSHCRKSHSPPLVLSPA
eukprot:m.22768 g.22768  ORF g.22768 m.22768 type:complete len:229 (+) comp6944_c0_seq1:270-956(+)